MRYILSGLLFLFVIPNVFSQLLSELDDEEKFYAETKQVNQFFHRFNGEEDTKGNRLYEKDKDFRSNSLRKNYLKILFDYQNTGLDKSIAREFISDVNDKESPQYIDFHDSGWFAQVNADFIYEGKPSSAILFLELEQENLGYKWVISKVYFEPFVESFIKEGAYNKKFIHPMSHELDFMNLRKAFADRDSIEQYMIKGFRPDYLSLFLYEMQRGKLTFKNVTDVKFHFFQVDNWYFEIAYLNREGMNTGWLISNLVKYKPEDIELLTEYIFYEN